MRRRTKVTAAFVTVLMGGGAWLAAPAARAAANPDCIIDLSAEANLIVCAIRNSSGQYVVLHAGEARGYVYSSTQATCFNPTVPEQPSQFIVDQNGTRLVESAEAYPLVCPVLFP